MKAFKQIIQPMCMAAAFSLAAVLPAAGQTAPDTQESQPATGFERTQEPQGMDTDTLMNTDQDFLMKTAQAHGAEIQLGELALERSQSDQVKEFARVVIEDHKKADQELAKILQANNINYRAGTFESGRGEEMGTVGGTAGSTPLGTDSGKKILENDPYSPANQNRRRSAVDVDRAKTETPIATQLASDQQELINRLQLLSGPQFDGVFMEAMVTNHQQSVQMHEELIRTSDNNQIRDYASRQLPILREHLQTAQNLQRAAMNAGAGQN